MMGEGNGLPELPQRWVWTTIGEVTQSVEKVKPKENPDTQFTYLDISSIDNQINRVVKPKTYYGSEAPSRARQLVQANDVLFSTVRTYLKNIALVPEIHDGQIASTGFSVLRGESDISPKYLFYYSLTDQFINPLSKLQRGTSYPAVRDSDVRAQPISLPPAAEQRRIVAKIEELFTQLDAGVAALEQAQAQLRRYRQAVLKAAVEGELTREWREAHRGEIGSASALLEQIHEERLKQGNSRPKTIPSTDLSEFPQLPEKWIWTDISDIGKVIGGLTKNRKRKKYPLQMPYLRVANVYADELRLDDVKTIGIKESELERILLEKGDLLVVEGNGSIKQIGRVALWDGRISPCVHQNHIIKVRFNPVEIGEYVLYWLLSNDGREQITHVASSTSGLYTLSLSKVSALPVPLPPLSEQRKIVEEVERCFSVIDEMEKAVQQSQRQAERLRQSVLKRAFEGKLVPQEPSDEPASALLARIQAEKARREAEKKARKRSRKKKSAAQLELL